MRQCLRGLVHQAQLVEETVKNKPIRQGYDSVSNSEVVKSRKSDFGEGYKLLKQYVPEDHKSPRRKSKKGS